VFENFSKTFALLIVLITVPHGDTVASSPTGWSRVVVPTGAYRQKLDSIPIQRRPGRLLHVYGNTVRLIDQSRRGYPVRPLRQVLIGTPDLREDVIGSR
jgi:hypothetical protein